ncbi:MAG: hypothetical protein QOI44_509 [Actinomycetota bacterium]|jgi:hypothetical protein|nr:hypothetical protein [Actinomycetota bacterium]
MTRGPPSAETGTEVGGAAVGEVVVGAEVVDVVDDVLGGVDDVLDAVLEGAGGRFGGLLLLQPVNSTSAAAIAIEASRSRRTQRS